MIKNLLKFSRTNLLIQWIALFIFPALLIIATGMYYYYTEKTKEKIAISTHESAVVMMGKNSIEHTFDIAKSDLKYLSNYHDFQTFLNTNNYQSSQHLTEDFQLFMQSRRIYDQIRWIDKNGKENIRIDYKNGVPIRIADTKLQNKGDRYYFIDAMKLPAGSIYLSPFDLNIEQGKVELPYKPMIRLATPIVDINAHKRGIFIINYLGDELLKVFERNTILSRGDAMLLNRDGYWFKGAKSDEWGFMLNRKDLTIAKRYPAVWKKICATESGQFQEIKGLWTFQTVYPLDRTDKDFWKVVTFVSDTKLRHNSSIKLEFILMASFLLLLIAGAGSLVLVYAYKRKKEALQEVEKFSKAVEQIDDIVYMTDRFGNITYVNSAFCRQTGYTKEEAIGKNPKLLKSGKHTHEFYAKLWRVIFRGEAFHDTMINRKKDGELYYEKKTITPLRDEQNNITGFISTGKDVTEETILNQEIKRIAMIDQLTGIYNRHKFEEQFAIESERSIRFSQPLSMMLIDIDHFKNINDAYGHDVGDEVLKELVLIVHKNIRKIDVFARWGGEEFLILCPSSSENSIRKLAEKLRMAVEKAIFRKVGCVTISIGISSFGPEDSFNMFFKRADQGLYYAKEHGRNQVGSVSV